MLECCVLNRGTFKRNALLGQGAFMHVHWIVCSRNITILFSTIDVWCAVVTMLDITLWKHILRRVCSCSVLKSRMVSFVLLIKQLQWWYPKNLQSKETNFRSPTSFIIQEMFTVIYCVHRTRGNWLFIRIHYLKVEIRPQPLQDYRLSLTRNIAAQCQIMNLEFCRNELWKHSKNNYSLVCWHGWTSPFIEKCQ